MISAIIVAAGSGTRMGLGHNKIFIKIDNTSLYIKSILALKSCDEIILVIREEDKPEIQQELDLYGLNDIKIVIGGATRQQSVFNGISAASGDTVLIHDAARPFVNKKDIQSLIHNLQDCDAAILASKAVDTIKIVDSDLNIIDTPDRDSLYHAETPQAFKRDIILNAHLWAQKNGISVTDDASLIEAMGKKVKVVESSGQNKKITKPGDIIVSSFRVGHGFDVHRLVQDRKLILCGVQIPFEKGLLGHSDADVATHALMDAMLGAAALGDIGRHFPDSDQKYKDANSLDLLKKVIELLRKNSFYLYQADITIIAQAPKISPFVENMRENIAKACNIDINNINIKASTTEKLGFCGRGEGIACEAVALIKSTEA
ncbi:MAG: 2-C-methyl-D-erythritol 4-phosphate cytidylyltransferase [Eubacteriales bacterium]|nr:2-C-methyl-D-erythritol 4-phosphate cytidylyltransferase [Eubacteriales bacterium]